MNLPNQKPLYNLKAVLKETGLKAEVLRAWERRYGLPHPQRTPGGHRLYSQLDIELIKWLLTRQGEGLSIRSAVQLWNEIQSRGQNPLGLTVGLATPDLDGLREIWLQDCLNFDETAAEQTLNQAFGLYGVEPVCRELIQRGLNQIGELWYAGRASVQQEHFTSALAVRRIDTLLASTPPPSRGMTLLLACPAGEWHTFTPLLLTLLFRRRGWGVIYLGANVPAAQLKETVAAIRPALVILAAQHLVSAASLAQAAEMLTSAAQLAYGGRVFNLLPALRTRIPAHFLGETFDAALMTAERLADRPLPAPAAAPVPPAARTCLRSFRAARPAIESALVTRLAERGLPVSHIETANGFFGDGLAAALELGDPAYLEPDMTWLASLLGPHQVDPGRLAPYLNLYADLIRAHLGPQGMPITEWISAHVRTVSADTHA